MCEEEFLVGFLQINSQIVPFGMIHISLVNILELVKKI